MSGAYEFPVLDHDVSLKAVPPSGWAGVEQQVLALERESFPPSIQEEKETLRREASSPSSLLLVATVGHGRIVGYLLADRLENYADVPGVRADTHFGEGDTLYISSVAVASERRGKGIGLALQRECFRLAEQRGYRRAAAHLRQGAARRIKHDARALATFDNWYGTEERFEYVVFPL